MKFLYFLFLIILPNTSFAASAGAGEGDVSPPPTSKLVRTPLTTLTLDGNDMSYVSKLLRTNNEVAHSYTTIIARDIPIRHKPLLLNLVLHSSVTHLFIASSFIQDEDIIPMLESFPGLVEVGLHDNNLVGTSIPLLMRLEHLKTLDLSNNYLNEIVGILHRHPSLETLDLSFNASINITGEAISSFLDPSCRLKSLKLIECGIKKSQQTSIQARYPDCQFIEIPRKPTEETRHTGPRGQTLSQWLVDDEREEDVWHSYGDGGMLTDGEDWARFVGDDEPEEYGGGGMLTDAEARARFGGDYYGYSMDEAHLEYMNRTWSS